MNHPEMTLRGIPHLLVHVCIATKVFSVFGCSACYFLDSTKKRPMGLDTLLENQLVIGKSSRSCTYTLFLTQGGTIELIWSTGSSFQHRGHFSNLPYLGMKFGQWPKFQNLYIYILFLPQTVENELIFPPRVVGSDIQGNFQNCHIWA